MRGKLGFLVYGLDKNPSGIGHYSQHLLEGLISLGCYPTFIKSGGWPKNYHPEGSEIFHLRGAGILPSLLTLGQLQIGWIARERGLDIIHDPIGIAPLAFCHSKRVVTLHDVFPLSIPGNSTLAETLLARYWLPWIVHSLDAVITDSQCSKKDICEYLHMDEDKIMVVPASAGKQFRPLDYTEVEKVTTRYHLTQPYILYVGALEPRKNLLRLVEAFGRINLALPQYKLVLVGASRLWKNDRMTQLVAELGLQDRVIFTGYVPDEDLPAVYNGADLFCFLSLYEGFGLPVLEAMACGTPVVTSNTSSLPEVAGDAAMLVDPYDVDAIATAMRRVIEEPGLAQELREKGLARASQFTWEKTARETIAVYEKVLGEKLL